MDAAGIYRLEGYGRPSTPAPAKGHGGIHHAEMAEFAIFLASLLTPKS